MKKLSIVLAVIICALSGVYSVFMIYIKCTTDLTQLDMFLEYWYYHLCMVIIGCFYLYIGKKLEK